MLPGINALQTLKLETYEASLLVTIGILTRQELQMLTHLIACRKTEGWMVLAELNQILIEVNACGYFCRLVQVNWLMLSGEL